MSEEKKPETERRKRVVADSIYDEDGFEWDDEEFSDLMKKQKKQETSHEGLTSLLKEIVHKPEDSSGQDTSQNPEKL